MGEMDGGVEMKMESEGKRGWGSWKGGKEVRDCVRVYDGILKSS